MADPHWTVVAKDVVTTAGIVIGGTWAVWKWGYVETIRRRREMASPDGTLEASAVRLDQDRIIVTLVAVWRNRGPVPISLCPEHSRVESFLIDSASPLGAMSLNPAQHISPMSVADPPWREYVMEPNTDSVMHQHFVVTDDTAYGFKWTICLAPGSFPGRYKDRHMRCTRELLWRFEDTGGGAPAPST